MDALVVKLSGKAVGKHGKIEGKQIPAEAILAWLLMARLPLAHLVKHLPEALK